MLSRERVAMGVNRTPTSIQAAMWRWRVLEGRSRTTLAGALVVLGEGGYGGQPDSFLDTDNHVALAGVSESSSVGADRRLTLASNRRCSPCRHLSGAVLLGAGLATEVTGRLRGILGDGGGSIR